VEVEWLGYGSAADLTSLLQEPLHAVDLVVLLVRLSDLRTAHPELPAVTAEASSENRFLEQLRAYDRPAAPPLVVLFCPSPPLSAVDLTASYQLEEAALSRAIQPLQRVACFPSSDATDFFLHDNDDCRWYDVTRDKREHAPFTQPMLDVLALRCVRQIARLRIRSPKKVLVLDCDNTLWGGAVADIRPARVQLSERFLALQRFAVDQQKRGVLLCLCSKNVAEDVDAVFRERASEMVLSKDKHIVVSKVNWHAKSHNLREIAQQLRLGLDTFVFVDDNAVECHEVQSALPMVTVVHVPDDFGPTFLATQWALDTPFECQATDEDAERTKQYQQNAQRQELERRATSHAAFLSSLGVRIQSERLRDVDSPAFARVLQLHQRTNTFNVATTFSRTLTRERLAAYLATHVALASTVTDRYGHYGLVCATLFRVETGEDGTHTTVAVVDSFLMSCRALNRGVEHAMLKQIAETVRSCGADTIRVAWEPTVRNEPVRMFFALLSASVFVTVEGEHVTTRAAKIERSAAEGGWWLLRPSDALKISFLKDQQDTQGQQAVEQEGTMAVVVAWRRPSWAVIVRLAKATIQFVLRWMPRKWIAWLLSWLLLGKKTISSSSDTTRDATKLSFHTRAQLHAFLVARLDAAVETSAQESPAPAVPNPLAEDRETDEAFRLRVRHDTKLLLQQHVAPDEPRVVWAPQRSDDVRFDSDDERVETPSSDTLQQFHRPCATPSCAAQVYWGNTCTFRRCRTCCYRVQRLLARATSDQAHAKACAHAWASLANDFNVRANDVDVAQEWCSAHTNDRRRK
jgi:FkbH-like protein